MNQGSLTFAQILEFENGRFFSSADERHFGKNRSQRHIVQKDIINAKIVQHEEELRLQEEKMREIEEKKRM